MTIKVVTCIDELKRYIDEYRADGCEILWETLVVEPYWDELCRYSPVDLSERKPECVKDVAALKKQIEALEKTDFAALERDLTAIADTLPNYDDDPISVMLYPLDDADVREKQNGVVGTSLFGNIMIRVDPLAADWEKWVRYVFAHEYHHTVWGNYWFNLHGGELKNDLIQALVIDGEADSFSMSICGGAEPEWLYLRDEEKIRELYEEKYKPHLFDTKFDYPAMMFGDEEKGIRWCGGYAVGYLLVRDYLERNPRAFSELVEVRPDKLI